MVERARARSSVRTAVVWSVLRAQITALATAGRGPLDVLDVGGGTGGFAVPVAELGHRVTVVDPSPDALAALERRTAEAGVTAAVRAVQGDFTDLLDRVSADSADLVLCHGVLEQADDPVAAVGALTAVLRPRGVLSVLAANRHAAVLSRAVAGRFAEAHRALDDPAGRWGDADPVPRRFDLAELTELLAGGGLAVSAVHGVRVFSDLVPGALLDGEPGALAALLALEDAAATRPAFCQVAAQLHLLASRP
ncbi:MAG: methyltransferase domain-containing protein [Actinomycetota bacterium]